MGQYWIGTIVKEDGSHIDVYKNYLLDKAGNKEYVLAKLLEHGYLGNPYVDSIAKKIYKNPGRVAWVGDYAEGLEFKDLPYEAQVNLKKLGLEHFHKEIYQYCYSDADKEHMKLDAPIYGDKVTLHPGVAPDLIDTQNKFLVNHDQKTYIWYNRYYAISLDEYGYVINPIPILTAISNDLGGGDYHDCYVNYDLVGSWALDLLSIEDEPPEDYKEEIIWFKENYI